MPRLTPRAVAPLALVAVLGLSACTAIGPAYGGYPTYPPSSGYPNGGYGRPDDYHATAEWRTLDRDAARYAREVDRAVGLRGSESRAVERLVRDRARRLLQQTPPRSHRAVYPFPRNERNATARRWWDDTDRAIERTLNRRQRDLYRRFTRGYGGYNGGYPNDGRSHDGRYDDRDGRNDYPGIRYDDRDDGRDGDGDRGRIGTGNGRDGGRSVREEAVPREGRRPAPRPDPRATPRADDRHDGRNDDRDARRTDGRNDARGTDRDGDRGPAGRGTAPRDARRTTDEAAADEAAEDRDGDRTPTPPARTRPARRNG